MKLLFDNNISRMLLTRLADVFPGSTRVVLEGMERADDEIVWAYAIEHGCVIVSKDEDLHQRALLAGPPPKLIWVRLGNCSTDDIEQAIRDAQSDIEDFVRDDLAAFLALGSRR